jgi:poly(A) polymerase
MIKTHPAAGPAPSPPGGEPVILDRSRHPISRREIDPDALKVLYRLHRNGFLAYLVGGAVRDLLLRKTPHDFDLGTDARPNQIKRLFRNAFLIGRRFRLAHIHFQGGKVIEVSTFRCDPEPEPETDSAAADDAGTGLEVAAPAASGQEGEEGTPETKAEREPGAGRRRPPAHPIAYGTPREDAFRRDITINALFYDIATFSVIDYVGGLEDIAARRIRTIGDPVTRYTEDPVRIWRVLRHAARLDFGLEAETCRAIEPCRDLLRTSSGARLYEELNKDLKSGTARPLLEMMRTYALLPILFGEAGGAYQASGGMFGRLGALLDILDHSVAAGEALSATEMYSLFYWPWLEPRLATAEGDRFKALHELVESASMAVLVPNAVRANVVQTLLVVDHMLHALETGRMRWSLRKRVHYREASRVLSLILRATPGREPDPFERLFTQKFPGPAAAPGRLRRPRRRRGRHRPAEPRQPV